MAVLRPEPGSVPRNGMPPSRDYAYQGSGEDALTPQGVMIAWNRQLRALGVNPRATSREEMERLAAAQLRLASLHEAGPSPRPRRMRPAPAGAPDAPPEATAPEPALQPAPAERCESCGYLETVIGHKVACGDGAA